MFESVADALLWEEQSTILLEVLIDSLLKFGRHGRMICKKASQKLTSVLRRAF